MFYTLYSVNCVFVLLEFNITGKNVLTVFAKLRSVCVAGLFLACTGKLRVYRSLRFNTRQHALSTFLFILLYCGVFFIQAVADCGILEETNSRMEVRFKEIVVCLIIPGRYRTRLTLKCFFFTLSPFSAKRLIFMNLKTNMEIKDG